MKADRNRAEDSSTTSMCRIYTSLFPRPREGAERATQKFVPPLIVHIIQLTQPRGRQVFFTNGFYEWVSCRNKPSSPSNPANVKSIQRTQLTQSSTERKEMVFTFALRSLRRGRAFR